MRSHHEHVSDADRPGLTAHGRAGRDQVERDQLECDQVERDQIDRVRIERSRVEMVMSELSHVLWQQRDLVTQLIYRLEVQQMVLASGRTRWIQAATSDVEDAIDDVRRQEQFREALVSDLSSLLGTPTAASLRQLIDASPTPWDGILAEHHSEFLRLTAHVEETTRANAQMLHGGLADVEALLGSIGITDAESYPDRRSGSDATSAPLHALLVDEDA